MIGRARFDIEGHSLGYPTSFRDGSSMMGMFLVSTAAANRLLAPTGFAAAEVLPTRSVVSLNCVHYTDTDCGAYDEIAFAVLVRDPCPQSRLPYLDTWRKVVRGDVAAHSWRLAVTTTLSRDTGLLMWGFPKTLEDLRYTNTEGTASMSWHDGDQEVLRYSVPTRGRRRSKPISPPVYSIIDGEPHVGRLTQSYTDVGHHALGGRLVLGAHPVADELRGLGVRARPLVAVWNGHLSFTMSAPEPLG